MRQVQVAYRFTEINIGRSLNPIGAFTEINLVHVHFQNFGFGVFAFNLQRQNRFLEFTFQGAVLRQKRVAGELLRNRTAALRDAVVRNVGKDRAHDAAGIDTVMIIKTDIFRCQKGMLQILGDLIQRNR